TYDGRSRSTVEELRRHANKALHSAKTQGKDCVDLYSDGAGDSRPTAPADGSLGHPPPPPRSHALSRRHLPAGPPSDSRRSAVLFRAVAARALPRPVTHRL